MAVRARTSGNIVAEGLPSFPYEGQVMNRLFDYDDCIFLRADGTVPEFQLRSLPQLLIESRDISTNSIPARVFISVERVLRNSKLTMMDVVG